LAQSINISYRPVKIDFNSIKVDNKKKTISFTTEFGHKITSKIVNGVIVNQTTNYPDHPDYVVNLGLTPIKVADSKNPKSIKEIRDILKNRDVLEDSTDYDDIMIGFVYADDKDPMNHTWMFQFRKNDQIVGTLNYLNIDILNCPMKSYAWHEFNIWHLRLVVDKKDIKMVEEYEFNKVRLIGKGIKLLIDSSSMTIPTKYDKLRLRCDVKNNFWLSDFILDSKVIKTIKSKDIKLNSNVFGEALFDHPKPWVSQNILQEDIQDIQIIDDLLIIQGKTK